MFFDFGANKRPGTFQNDPKRAANIILNDLASTLCQVQFFDVGLVQNHMMMVTPLTIKAETDEKINR